MIEITQSAAQAIANYMATSTPDALGIRLAVRGHGCSGFGYDMSVVRQGNKTMLDDVYPCGRFSLFVDQCSRIYLDGMTIDYVTDLMGSGFRFNNPHVTKSCGCGHSVAFD
jgi:iron-sulfur cluster assembly protein